MIGTMRYLHHSPDNRPAKEHHFIEERRPEPRIAPFILTASGRLTGDIRRTSLLNQLLKKKINMIIAQNDGSADIA